MAKQATYLPTRPPVIGELVEVRSRRWLVEAVDTPPRESARVSLACADDDAQGQTLEVNWDFDIRDYPGEAADATTADLRRRLVGTKVDEWRVQ